MPHIGLAVAAQFVDSEDDSNQILDTERSNVDGT